MTVGELITELERFPGDWPVYAGNRMMGQDLVLGACQKYDYARYEDGTAVEIFT